MIKGKWRIDLGGKIKGAKSVALGSAVTKRGQDNSLQMCERCKYQTGEGRQLGGPGESGRGLGRPPGGLGGRGLGDSSVAVAPHRWRSGVGAPGSKQVSFLGRSFLGLGLLSTSKASPTGALRSRVQIPLESLGTRLLAVPKLTSHLPFGILSLKTPARLSGLPPPSSPPRRWRATVSPSAVEASGAAACSEVTLPRSREPGECK